MSYLLSYKLNDGRHAKLFNHDLLRSDKNGKYYRKTAEVSMYDEKGECLYFDIPIDILTDEESKKLYFEIEGEKKYISDFEYFDADELVNRFKNKEKVSFDMFVASLIKNSDKLAFIEERMVPDMVFQGIMRSYSGEREYKHVICEILEKFYEKEGWFYKFETVPISEEEKIIYGREAYYTDSYYNRILEGHYTLILKSDIDNYDFSNEKPYTYKRKRTM